MTSHQSPFTSFLLIAVASIALPLTVFVLQQKQDLQQRAATPASNSQVFSVEQSILNNIKQNGYDANTPGGGLWVNWRYGTDPLQTNFDGTGTSYPGGLGTNHDPLTDIRYIHNLWLYKSQNPDDNRYDSEISRYTPIVKAEWANTNNERGWLFDEEFMDTFQIAHDNFYQTTAMGLAASYAKAINPNVGIMYKTSSTHPQGYYRPADVLEAACALIQAGTISHNTSWVQLGQTALNFVYAHAYIQQYHTFGQDMDQVLTTTGKVNPNEIFYIDKTAHISGNEMRTGEIAQMVLSLLFTYKITHVQDYLTKAEDILNSLSLPANPLGMWDNINSRNMAGVFFNGTSPQQPGTLSVAGNKKEAGRQVTLLWAFDLSNQLTSNIYQSMENQMLQVALTKAYYAPGHGVLYEVNSNWTPLNFPNGQVNDVVTTEAMGAELEGLLAVSGSKAQPTVTFTPSSGPFNSPTLSQTTTPNPNNINVFLTVCPHGLGGCGDNVNPSSVGNINPSRNTRNITLTIFDTHNNKIALEQGQVAYVSQAQNFQGIIHIANLSSGTYIINLKMDGFLEKQIPGVISVTTGQTVSLPPVSLVNGDINNDNQLNILDYNVLLSCFGSKFTTSACLASATSENPGADIDDDGSVDGVDYNEFLRELSAN